jgi:hypothetical protein
MPALAEHLGAVFKAACRRLTTAVDADIFNRLIRFDATGPRPMMHNWIESVLAFRAPGRFSALIDMRRAVARYPGGRRDAAAVETLASIQLSSVL